DLQVHVDCCEANERPSEHGRAEAETPDGGICRVVCQNLRKDEQYIVNLVAPEIHVGIRVKNSAPGAQHVPPLVRGPCHAEAWSNVVLVGEAEALWISELSADEGDRHAAAEIKVRQDLTDVMQRCLQLVTETRVDRQR